MGVQLEDINKQTMYAAHRWEQDIIIKPEHIYRFKDQKIFKNSDLNRAVLEHCRWVLRTQMNSNCHELYLDFDNGITEPVKYGETLILVSMIHPYSKLKVCYGDHKNVISDSEFIELELLARKNSLITIHNHPGGGGLSWADIKLFVYYDSVQTQMVVTNHGRLFWMTKLLNFDRHKTMSVIDEIEQKYPATGIEPGSNAEALLQQKRRSVIEPNLYKMGIVYRTIG